MADDEALLGGGAIPAGDPAQRTDNARRHASRGNVSLRTHELIQRECRRLLSRVVCAQQLLASRRVTPPARTHASPVATPFLLAAAAAAATDGRIMKRIKTYLRLR